MTVDQEPSAAEPRSPLTQPWFRAIWIASLVSNLGTWMQNVGASWLMTSLTTSPALVALLQTAASIPVLLLGLPAGALADIVNRRRLLLVAQVWTLLAAVALGVLTFLGAMNAWTLLLLTFLLGLGGALTGPAWQATVPDLVDPPQIPAAIALNSAGFNLARAVGPAIGGIVVAAVGAGAVFLLNAASFLAVLLVVARWPGPKLATSAVPERVTGAIQAGVRYARHSPELRAVLARTALFIVPASALWALLPIVARQDLGLDAGGYGLLFGCLGVGAVAGALLLARLRRLASPDAVALGASLLFAGATLALALVRERWLLSAALVAGGVAWTTSASSFTVAVQTSVPAWVRARALALYLLVFQGGLGLGSPAWGVLAGSVGSTMALTAAAGLLAVGCAGALRWRLPAERGSDLSPALHWPEPALVVQPDHDDGPVLVTVTYTVDHQQAAAFTAAMQPVRFVRRRDGATRWALFRDLEDGTRFIETFVVPSWAEHLRQHERVTVADQQVEAQALRLIRPGTTPQVLHAIAAHTVLDNHYADDGRKRAVGATDHVA